ncbi:MAG: sulfotransferase [Planctomycetota bacterium]|nr:sulfotransferase [Planctomycetota bacterium]
MSRRQFFLVGAQRSGTTYLYNLLDAHPEIEMARPVRPEPKFFLDETYRQRGREEYEATFFDPDSKAQLRGEKSTSYIESEAAAQRIHEFYPQASILFLLREPVARAISNYRFSETNGLETLSMWEAFEREAERREQYDASQVSTSPFAYLQRGRYVDYLAIYERVFGAAALHVMLYEDLVAGAETISRLYEFLGVAHDFLPSGLDDVVNATPGVPTPLTSEQQASLRTRFEEPNSRLSSRYGIDLSAW